MRTVAVEDIGRALRTLLDEPYPLEADIAIVDGQGAVVGVVIGKDAYDFLLQKTAEEEDAVDNASIAAFRHSGEANTHE